MALDSTDSRDRETLGAFARRVLVLLVIVVLALLLWKIVDALLLAFIGILLAVMFRGLAGLLHRYTRLPMRWSLLVVGTLFLAILFLFGWFAGPRFNEQLAAFGDTVPTSLTSIRRFLERYNWGRFLLEHLGSGQLNVGGGLGLFSRIIVQQIENRLLVPLVQWKAVSLPPALVILAVVALGLLFGVLGVLVATPLTAVLMIWIQKLYVEDVLGKNTAR